MISLFAVLELAVNMELAFNTPPVETTFVFVSLVGKAILVTDAYLIGNVHNPITLTVFQHVSIQMTVSVQHPV